MKSPHGLVLLALIALAVPLFADSPEYPVGATVPAPAPGHRQGLAAATDGLDFLVVWADFRTPGHGAIMGTRVKRSGQVVDPLGIRIASQPAAMSWPAVVWDGAAYVVVWTQGIYYGESLQREEVWAARLDRDGRILTAPRLISEAGLLATTTSGVYAASNGGVTVIAYRNFLLTGSVRIAVLDGQCNVIGRVSLPNASPDLARGMSVAATSTGFVLTWGTNDRKLFATILGADGRFIRMPVQIGDGEDPVVATDGTSVMLLWRHWMEDISKWVLLSRKADAELAAIGFVQTLADDQSIEWPSALWRGDRYEVIAGQQSSTQTRIYPYGLLSVEVDRDGNKRVSSRRGDPLDNGTV
ncbi:MAG TPA: hypothetical protein VN181_17135, partial [Thermoanaerobaculia bacterium]|nr:hypothetical protein [Thermoanaerobaculia bacterium]